MKIISAEAIFGIEIKASWFKNTKWSKTTWAL